MKHARSILRTTGISQSNVCHHNPFFMRIVRSNGTSVPLRSLYSSVIVERSERIHCSSVKKRSTITSYSSQIRTNSSISKPKQATHSNHATHQDTEGPKYVYNMLIASGRLQEDPHQRHTVELLQDLWNRLKGYSTPISSSSSSTSSAFSSKPSFFAKLFGSGGNERTSKKSSTPPRGLYLYGDVGTGKTMVMDLFYKTIQTTQKRRVHFHAFMLDVHSRIHQIRQTHRTDPIPLVADELAKDAWLLCFDELQVTDITDAMLLRRLFFELYDRGVVVVTTSNRHPDDLYKNGIQRKSFIPCIDLLKEWCLVHSLNSGIDYRRQKRESYKTFIWPLNDKNKSIAETIWKRVTSDSKIEPRTLTILGRLFEVPTATSTGYAKFTFWELCGQPHAAADYLELVKNFHTIFLMNMPKLKLEHRNEARRFITLLDAIYEHRRKLIITANAPMTKLFSGEDDSSNHTQQGNNNQHHHDIVEDFGVDALESQLFVNDEEVFAFRRAVSRLVEMQSLDWIGEDMKKVLVEVENS